ncbi:MAG: MBL fold metallo-hydrolase [Candidatus Deferrimicrobium sp.]
MKELHVVFLLLMTLLAGTAFGKERYETDVIPTGSGDLTITFLGHGSLLLSFDGMTIAIDPYSKVADYTTLPKADIILVTHEHGDHLDLGAIKAIRSDRTVVAANPAAAEKIPGAMVLKNGDKKRFPGIRKNSPGIQVIAVPAGSLSSCGTRRRPKCGSGRCSEGGEITSTDFGWGRSGPPRSLSHGSDTQHGIAAPCEEKNGGERMQTPCKQLPFGGEKRVEGVVGRPVGVRVPTPRPGTCETPEADRDDPRWLQLGEADAL